MRGQVPNYRPRFQGYLDFAEKSEGTEKASSICVRQFAVCANYNSLSGNPQAGRNDIDKTLPIPGSGECKLQLRNVPGHNTFFIVIFAYPTVEETSKGILL
jgi:hypothetical protein